ncbi:MAG: bis(5'-nucleosyl)-tetraphosphatase (symmetrical) YqeK [Lachnospiraceae bacterium]|nr:bis(5'-nucleosyl)-tetraphosphatase (symmetrical) YqeK [Lachnospiraceae bacterium]
MDNERIRFLKRDLSKILSAHRYDHTIGVADTAFLLAGMYGADPDKAYLTGLLHDNAKAYSSDELLKQAIQFNLEITPIERRFPALLHAKVGAYYAKEKYGIDDEDILNAIAYHTTGRPNMTVLEKIIYIADYIEPGRDRQPNLNVIRKAAFTDIDTALLMILSDTVGYLKATKPDGVDPLTEETYIFYEDSKWK